MWEIWTPIVGTGGSYHVSTHGRIFSSRLNKVLDEQIGKSGHRIVTIYTKLGRFDISVRRAVASAYCGKGSVRADVKHLDGDVNNNFAYNLQWVE